MPVTGTLQVNCLVFLAGNSSQPHTWLDPGNQLQLNQYLECDVLIIDVGFVHNRGSHNSQWNSCPLAQHQPRDANFLHWVGAQGAAGCSAFLRGLDQPPWGQHTPSCSENAAQPLRLLFSPTLAVTHVFPTSQIISLGPGNWISWRSSFSSCLDLSGKKQ